MNALVLGGASWNRMVTVPSLPGPTPQTMVATATHEAIGSSGAGKALNLRRLGWDVTLWALLGDDEHGAKVRSGLAGDGVRLLAEHDPAGTMQHVNIMEPHGERISIFANPGSLDLAVDHAALVPEAVGADLVVLTIFEHCRGFLPLLAEAGVELWIDIHDYDGANPYHEDFIEAASYLQLSSIALPDWRSFAAARVAAGCRAVICTHGSAGASVLTDAGWVEVEAVRALRIVDANGAGDAFFAGFATGWALGLDAARCGERAALVAAAAVQSLDLAAAAAPPGTSVDAGSTMRM